MVRKVKCVFYCLFAIIFDNCFRVLYLVTVSPGVTVPVLNICADIQAFRAAALASQKLAVVPKLLFKILKSLPVTPPESLCAFHNNISLLPAHSSPLINEASWHYAASWLFAVSNFKLFKKKDFFFFLLGLGYFPGFCVGLVWFSSLSWNMARYW